MANAIITEVNETVGSPELTETVEGGKQYARTVDITTSPEIAGPAELMKLIDGNVAYRELWMGARYGITRPGSDGTTQYRDFDEVCSAISRTPRRHPNKATQWQLRVVYDSKAAANSIIPRTLYSPDDPPEPTNVSYEFDDGRWDRQRPVVELLFIDFLEVATRGRRVLKTGNPTFRDDWEVRGWGVIANSATDPILDPAPERHAEKSSLIITRNMDRLDIGSCFLLMNSVNTEPVHILYGGHGAVGDITPPESAMINYTIPKYGGRISNIVPRLGFRGSRLHWRITYEFDILDNTAASETAQQLDRSWAQDFLDRGFVALDPASQPDPTAFGPADFPGEVLAAVSDNRVAQMEMLLEDGKYKVLPTYKDAQGNDQFDLEAAHYVSYLLYDSLDWRSQSMFTEIVNNAVL